MAMVFKFIEHSRSFSNIQRIQNIGDMQNAWIVDQLTKIAADTQYTIDRVADYRRVYEFIHMFNNNKSRFNAEMGTQMQKYREMELCVNRMRVYDESRDRLQGELQQETLNHEELMRQLNACVITRQHITDKIRDLEISRNDLLGRDDKDSQHEIDLQHDIENVVANGVSCTNFLKFMTVVKHLQHAYFPQCNDNSVRTKECSMKDEIISRFMTLAL
jgi:hypothetical protein